MPLPDTDWIRKWALYLPDKIAVKAHESQQVLTYAALNTQANQLVRFLRDTYAIQKGDRIAILANNCLEYIVFFSAAQKAGWILVPLNYRLATPEIQYQIAVSDPVLLVVATHYKDKAEPLSCTNKVVMQDLFGQLDSVSAQVPAPVVIDANDPIFLLFTSGTTGFPKAAIYSHQMLFWNSINTAMSLLVNTESRTINCMPPFHTGGWNVLLTPFLHHGGYTLLMEKFDAAQILQLMQTEAPTLFMGVPTMLKMIADEPAFAQADLNSLYYLIVGGEPMPIPLIERWHAKGVSIRQGYGMTEVGPNLTSLHQNDAIRKKGSIGRPNFYVNLKIITPDGQPAPPNTPGELLLKGPMVTPGYWQNPDATHRAIRDGWFYTGDMAQQDEEGYLYIVDRIKHMFISGGENVYPAEVERILASHPDIQEVAVIAQADEKWGEVGKAIIVTTQGQTIDSHQLKIFCAARMAKFKIPRYFTFVEQLPTNTTGKIDRKRLQAEHTANTT